MHTILRIVSLTLLAFGSEVLAQQVAPALKVPPAQTDVTLTVPADSLAIQLAYTKQQNLVLQSQLLSAQYQKQSDDLQRRFQDFEQTITAWIAATKKANHFGDDVSYDREHDKWVRSTPAASMK